MVEKIPGVDQAELPSMSPMDDSYAEKLRASLGALPLPDWITD